MSRAGVTRYDCTQRAASGRVEKAKPLGYYGREFSKAALEEINAAADRVLSRAFPVRAKKARA